jgi:cobalt-zinc-cadmium efflux system outer membrane protein
MKPFKLVSTFPQSIGSFVLGIASLASLASAQQALTWDQVKVKFQASNPALRADEINVEEMKAAEITAYLRPNPQFTFSTD